MLQSVNDPNSTKCHNTEKYQQTHRTATRETMQTLQTDERLMTMGPDTLEAEKNGLIYKVLFNIQCASHMLTSAIKIKKDCYCRIDLLPCCFIY